MLVYIVNEELLPKELSLGFKDPIEDSFSNETSGFEDLLLDYVHESNNLEEMSLPSYTFMITPEDVRRVRCGLGTL